MRTLDLDPLPFCRSSAVGRTHYSVQNGIGNVKYGIVKSGPGKGFFLRDSERTPERKRFSKLVSQRGLRNSMLQSSGKPNISDKLNFFKINAYKRFQEKNIFF